MRRLVLLALLALLALGGGSSRLLGEGGAGGGAERGRVVRVVDGDTLKVRTGNRAVTVRLIGIDTPESVKPGAPVECGGKAAARALERRALTPRGRVVRVVDGDTLKVRTGNRAVTVRLIGIDTPESVKPGAPVECGSKAAARALERRALTPRGRGRGVRLVFDGSQDRRDRFGRLLAYVELAGGADLGEAQVRGGWAEPFVFEDDPFERAGRYQAAFDRAEDGRRGVHRLCGGDFHRPQ